MARQPPEPTAKLKIEATWPARTPSRLGRGARAVGLLWLAAFTLTLFAYVVLEETGHHDAAVPLSGLLERLTFGLLRLD